MKKANIILLINIVLTIIFSACTKQNADNCDPDLYCDTVPWDSGFVTINVTQNSTHGVPIIIYEGYVEDNKIVLEDTLYDASWEYYLPIDTRYAVEAYYTESTSTIIALDGDKLKQSSFTNCSETCYNEPGIDLDVSKL